MHIISRSLLKSNPLASTPLRLGGSIQPGKRHSIPKVSDNLVWLNVTDHDNLRFVVPCFVGESLLYALKQAKIRIPGTCGGGDQHIPETEDPLDNTRFGPSCGECQVILGEPWSNYAKPMGEWEYHRMLRAMIGLVTPRSRLSCCLNVEKWMNGMNIYLPEQDESKATHPYSGMPDKGSNRVLNY